MGSNQSVRATHFQRPDGATAVQDTISDEDDEHHISISNKMVERLVEDATLVSSTAPDSRSQKTEMKDKIYIEKLTTMDDNHSKKWGLTIEELNSLMNRIDRRTSNMVRPEPICEKCKQQILDCYEAAQATGDHSVCFGVIESFRQCVRTTANVRVNERAVRDAREHARLSRHVARARENVLRDLAPPPDHDEGVFA